MFDLQEYGVTKKWAIITEISKEVENNTVYQELIRMQDSMCLEVFVKGSPSHVLERVTLEDHIEEVVVLDVLDPPYAYTFICVEIKTTPKQSRLVCSKRCRGRCWTGRFFFAYRSSLSVLL